MALARGDAPTAVEALARARDGFAALQAVWEEAVAELWLGAAQVARGDVADARRAAEAAADVFDRVRSVRESEQARSLLSRIG